MTKIANTTGVVTDPSQIEPLIAGTLALMTRYPTRPCVCVSERIGENLMQLSVCQFLSPALRTLCDRLKADWQQTTATLHHEIAVHELHHATLQ